MGAKSIKVILILIILGGCLRTPKHPNNYYFKHLSSGNSQLAQKDKRDISHSFIMNVEYLRCNPEVFEQIRRKDDQRIVLSEVCQQLLWKGILFELC